MIIPPSPMDLTTVQAIQAWGNFGSTPSASLQICLTGCSIGFLRMTGRGPRNWQNVTQNPYNEPVSYSEVYDGISGNKLFLRNFPINSVSLLSVLNVAVPASGGPALPGYVIDDSGRSIAMRGGGGGASPDTFAYVNRYGNGYSAGAGAGRYWQPFCGGVQGVQVDYIAGFSTLEMEGDLYTIVPAWTSKTYSYGAQVSDGVYLQTCVQSGEAGVLAPTWNSTKSGVTTDGQAKWSNAGITQAPNTVVVGSERAVLADGGVDYFSSGDTFSPVLVAPAAGQYYLIQQGTYLFNAADAGQQVQIAYTAAGTPEDIILAVMQLVSLNYKRRDWIGQRMVMMKDVGSTAYTLDIDPGIKEVIERYRRRSWSN